ncbi:CAP domain-containing protein [Cognatishimia sp. SS12]|uniref:CAP domain-containing protein n=1 Tax=Cognatishimia sp. SS12 TaxID=2979465 RepID=UPI00232C61F7|nr:CAP domain-containing protein [Cognatishimia sp. SS12]MDC0737711.1 CAP domain-containing protein [Cognatishimia sp. SS12]
MRIIAALMVMLMTVAACTSTVSNPPIGADGKPLPRLYRIRAADTSKIQFRMLDSVNALRGASGLAQVELDKNLVAAAATHSRDMSIQNRPWHFGSDGSSPIDRVARAGYTGQLVGETISETYETELETLGAWMEQPGQRDVIMDPTARDMGFAWYQESNGKIWWTLVMGRPAVTATDDLFSELQ